MEKGKETKVGRKQERPADELATQIDGLMRASEFEWTWKELLQSVLPMELPPQLSQKCVFWADLKCVGKP